MKIAGCRSAQHMFARVTQQSDILIQYFSTLAPHAFMYMDVCWQFIMLSFAEEREEENISTESC
jgi:hypothetical protein